MATKDQQARWRENKRQAAAAAAAEVEALREEINNRFLRLDLTTRRELVQMMGHAYLAALETPGDWDLLTHLRRVRDYLLRHYGSIGEDW